LRAEKETLEKITSRQELAEKEASGLVAIGIRSTTSDIKTAFSGNLSSHRRFGKRLHCQVRIKLFASLSNSTEMLGPYG